MQNVTFRNKIHIGRICAFSILAKYFFRFRCVISTLTKMQTPMEVFYINS